MAVTLAEVLRRFGPDYLRTHNLSTAQAKAWRAIVSCRTPALGGHLMQCDACGEQQWRWHSCRNRHCPQCQSQARDAWRRARLGELLDVPYCHLVFTLPHELNVLAAVQPRWVYETLMRCVAATLTEFAANPRWLGGIGAFTLVLHTWTQDLRRHLHVHALMACGALCGSNDAASWRSPTRGPGFLFPVQALSRVLRGKFLAALAQANHDAILLRDPLTGDTAGLHKREAALRAKEWVVYAKTPLAGPAAVLDYLARYTHRTAIGHERLLAIEGDRLRVRVRKHAGGKPCISIGGVEFVGRFLQHVLPPGFKRIRHYGLLAPAAKRDRLAAARCLLCMPAPNPVAWEDACEFMRRVAAMQIARCTRCGKGTWIVVGEQPVARHVLAREPPIGRGPP